MSGICVGHQGYEEGCWEKDDRIATLEAALRRAQALVQHDPGICDPGCLACDIDAALAPKEKP
jgi:hypothetical protein